MNKFQATLLTVLVCLACLGGWLYYQKVTVRGKYSATTKFQILQGSQPDTFGSVRADGKPEGNWLDNQITLLSSPTLLTRVVKVLNLDAEWKMTPEKALERVQERVEVTADRGTEIISVTGWGKSPNAAAQLANTVRKMYEETRIEWELEMFRRLTQNVGAQIEEQQKKVEAGRLEMVDMQKKYGITGAATLLNGTRDENTPWNQPEYKAAKQRYESSVMLLNTMRELSARQEVDEGVVKRPIQVLEDAKPPAP